MVFSAFVRHLREIKDRFVSMLFFALLDHIYNSFWYRAISFVEMILEDMSESENIDISNDFVSRLDRDGYVLTNEVCNGN